MTLDSRIQVDFDFQGEAGGRDPDAYSPTLRRYHRILWSKPLPRGVMFDLVESGRYLHHKSAALDEFWLSSDSVVPTFLKNPKLKVITDALPTEERQAFWNLAYTMGGMMVFPANKVDGKMTVNAARGFDSRIRDRFDLTVECIRRHYRSETSPLADVLRRYDAFFDLFADFRGYVEFFLLQDIVTPDGSVRMFAPFLDFEGSPIPDSLDEYRAYKELAMGFINSRNQRINHVSSERNHA